jgi:hypothetical protein
MYENPGIPNQEFGDLSMSTQTWWCLVLHFKLQEISPVNRGTIGVSTLKGEVP